MMHDRGWMRMRMRMMIMMSMIIIIKYNKSWQNCRVSSSKSRRLDHSLEFVSALLLGGKIFTVPRDQGPRNHRNFGGKIPSQKKTSPPRHRGSTGQYPWSPWDYLSDPSQMMTDISTAQWGLESFVYPASHFPKASTAKNQNTSGKWRGWARQDG